MKMPLAVGLIVGFLLISALIGRFALSVPSMRLALLRSRPMHPVVMRALGDYTDSEGHAKYFLSLLRQHQYAQARSLMTPNARRSLSARALQGQWAAFESLHGRVTDWSEAGGTDNLLPEYVDRRYQVRGSRRNAGFVTLHMVNAAPSQPAPGNWQADSLTTSR